MTGAPVDVCLILEGTYPYVVGGVASWTHELIKKQDHLTFHVVAILPRDEEAEVRFQLPKNLKGLTTVHLQRIPENSDITKAQARKIFEQLKAPLLALSTREATLEDFREIVSVLAPWRDRIGESVMLNSEEAWELTAAMYEASFAESSMLDYFWSWRAMMGSLYSLLIADLPEARCYHALNTGYGGLLASRAKLETDRPVILTEHGIYTNERRIEIASANWLEASASKTMTIDPSRRNLRDLWIDTFTNYSRICYEAASHIITLYTGNQQPQIADGAHPAKMRIISNGIDVERFGRIVKKSHARPAMAFIGRVVPIKDVKNFLRAVAAVKRILPDVQALIIGPADEAPAYAEECKAMVEYLALQDTVAFTGNVNIVDYLPEIDIIVSSSISEVQPLVILEAGAAGIPIVATDVGACREMIMGKPDEKPALGAGGIVVSLANPQALADACVKLFDDRQFYAQCCENMRARVIKYYNKESQYQAYKSLYQSCIG